MELAGFWTFISILILSTLFIFIMTRDNGDMAETNDEAKDNE